MRISDWSSDVCSSDARRAEGDRLTAMLAKLSLPLMCAPMSFASAVPLAVACCRAGVIGGWQGGTYKSGRAHVCTPVTNAHLVCRLLLEKKNKNSQVTARSTHVDNHI